MSEIRIPDFDFSGFYYPEILEALIQYRRINVPEITDENEHEPFNQLLRAFALVGHLNNVLLDFVSKNCFLPTSNLLEAVRSQFKLVGITLRQASPSTTEEILRLTKIFNTERTLVKTGSLFSTRRTAEIEAIDFEFLDDDYIIQRTDQLYAAFEHSGTGGWSVDLAATLNTDGIYFEDFPLVDQDDDEDHQYCFYFSHSEVFWNKFKITLADPARPMSQLKRFVVEYYQGDDEVTQPNSVTDGGSTLEFKIDSLFGEQFGSKDFTGTAVVVTYKPTGATETVYSTFDGTNNKVVTSLLGQSVPSTTVNDYAVGAHFLPVPNATQNLTDEFLEIEFSLPEDTSRHWENYTVQTFAGRWFRLRVIEISFDEIAGIEPDSSNSSPNDASVAGTYTGSDHEDYILTIKTPTNSITADPGNTSPDEATLTGTWNGSYKTDYVLEILTPGVYGTFTAKITRVSDDVVVLPAQTFMSGVPYEFDDGLSIVFTDGGSSSMSAGDEWAIYGAFRANVERVSDSTIVLPTQIFDNGVGYEFDAGLSVAFTNSIDGQMKVDDFWEITVRIPSTGKWDRALISAGDTFVKIDVTQGQTINEVIGTIDGTANQEFLFTRKPLIEESEEIYFGGTLGRRVDNFLNSTSLDLDYVLETDAEDNTKITIGDGINGRIPPTGSEVNPIYRIGGATNGNVGARTIVINKSGIAYVGGVYNPRPAVGWSIKEGSTPEDLERIKLSKPAELRSLGVALTLTEIERFATEYRDENGAKIVIRALAIEERYGIKTIGLVVVGSGGALLTLPQRTELDEYFNPDGNANDGVLVVNHRVYSDNYSPRTINVTANVTGGTEARIVNALKNVLRPDALADDGVNWRWRFGALVSLSKLNSIIFNADPEVTNVSFIEPTSDIQLLSDELPIYGTIVINIL